MTQPTKSYDVIVIGGGPAGYVAAIRCAQLGLNTVCIDGYVGPDGKHSLGGTCLNSGCIPSKALLESSEQFYAVQARLARHGIIVSGVELDVPAMIEHKNAIVKRVTDHIARLFQENNIETIYGHGRLLAGKTVEVIRTGDGGSTDLLASDIIILASGSSSVEIGAAPLDGEFIIDSCGALNIPSVPRRLGIIGAGVIGLELGSIWQRLGSEVILLEAQEEFLAITDLDVAGRAFDWFTRQGLDIRLGARVTSAKKTPKHVSLQYEDRQGSHRLMVDKLIVAVGRRPNTDDLFAPEADVLLDENGFIHVDEQCRTNLPGVYAIGDLVPGPMLAHKGSKEGYLVAEIIAGKERQVNYNAIPSVIYTEPEIAWVGQTEQALRTAGEDIHVGVFPLNACGRAQVMDKTEGMVKIIASAQTDRLLGVHIIATKASELIAEAVVAMEFSASAEDLARTVHAHPTLAEAIHEAALAVDGRALHIPNHGTRGGETPRPKARG